MNLKYLYYFMAVVYVLLSGRALYIQDLYYAVVFGFLGGVFLALAEITNKTGAIKS